MSRTLLVAVISTISLTTATRADNWPQWRGPNNDGICKEVNLPTKWSATENIAWTLPLPGVSGATPAIWGEHIFLISEDGDNLLLMCVSTKGKEIWRKRLSSATHRQRTEEQRGGSASPSTDGKHVWAMAGTGELACYDFNGNESWRVDLQERYGRFNIQFGMHSTPVLYGDRLYLQLLHSDANIVVALDKATGKEIWKVDRISDSHGWECPHSYASAMMWHDGKDAYLLTHGNDYTVAHDLKDGHELWRLGGLNPKDRYVDTLRFVASPVAVADLIVVPTAKTGAVVAVKPTAKGNFEAGSQYEQWRMPKGTPDVSSPLVYDGLVYLVGEWGTLTCLNAKTGEQQYSEPLFKGRVRHRASPVYADGKIYVTSRDRGSIHVVKAGPKFELLAKTEMPDDFAASPAIADGRIYLRGFKALYAIGPK
jgi:outer membrane protein assembly factor BamB